MTADVHTDRPSEGVVRITIHNEAKANALSPFVAARLLEEYEHIRADSSVGCVIVRGGGPHFCSGGDRDFLDQLVESPLDLEHYATNDKIYAAFMGLMKMNVPTIAAVRGAVVGAGINLMMASDLVVIAKDARVISGFANIGAHPGGGHYWLLSQKAGYMQAAALSVFGRELTGDECVEKGLAWSAVDESVVDDQALEIASALGKSPALSRLRLRSLRLESSTHVDGWSQAVEMERGVQMWSMANRQAENPTQT